MPGVENPPQLAAGETCQRMDPKVVFEVEEHDAAGAPVADSWLAVGCCITNDTPSAIGSSTVTEPDCMNFDCADANAESCSGPATAEPGTRNESNATFEVPYYPGPGTLTDWFECMARCREKRRWRKCYPNGTYQTFECAWVQSHTPSQNSAGNGTAKATVVLALCGDWAYSTV